MEAVLVFGIVALLLAALLLWAEKIERRERRLWHEEYRRRGGLIGALMRNWRPVPKLTDRRGREDER